MRVGSIFGNQANYSKNQQKNYSNINFEGHFLIKTFCDPNYKNLKVFVYELTNGQKVVIVPKKGPGSVTVNTVVKTGALNEIDRLRGISHFMEHLAFDGSAKGAFKKGLRPGEFIKIMEVKGADINAHTNTDKTAFFFNIAKASDKDFSDALKAHATMVKYPAMPTQQYKKEQQVVIQEIKQSQDRPAAKAYFTFIKDIFGIDSTTEHLTLGDEANISNATRKDVLAYHKQNYSPKNMETYVVGNVNPERTVSLVDKYFDTPDFRPTDKERVFADIRPIQQTKISFLSDSKMKISEITVGFNGPKNSDTKEAVATKALMYILGLNKNSRLNKKLIALDTEAGADLLSPSNHPNHPQILYFNIEIEPGKEQEVLNQLKSTVKELKTSPVQEEELEIIKRNMLDEFNGSCETSEGISGLLEDLATTGQIEAYENLAKYIKGLTPKDISLVAEKYLNPEKAAITILQPSTAVNTNISFKGKTSLIPVKNLKKSILPNNLKLIINDNIDTIRTAINFKLESNSNCKPGVAEILTQMMQIATSKHSREELEFIKSKNALNDLSIVSTINGIMATSDSLTEMSGEAIRLIKEMMFEPKLDKKTFEKAKNEFMLEIQSKPLSANDRAMETMYPNHPCGKSPRLLRQVLDKVTFQDIQGHYKTLIQSPKASVTITGPISNVEGLEKIFKEELGSIPKAFSASIEQKTFPKLDKSKVVVQLEPGRSQSHIEQIFHVDTQSVEEVVAMDLLKTVLSGGLSARLFRDLREKQKLAYQVGAVFNKFGNYSRCSFIIKTGIKDGAGISTNNIEKSILGFEKHQKRLMKELVTEKELEQAKKSLKTDYINVFTEVAEQDKRLMLGLTTPQGATYYNSLMNAIDKITAQDIRNAARKYLTQPSVTSVLTTEDAAKEAEAFLKTRGEYKLYIDETIDT